METARINAVLDAARAAKWIKSSVNLEFDVWWIFDYRFTTYQDAPRVRLVDGLIVIFETNILRVSPVKRVWVFSLYHICYTFLESSVSFALVPKLVMRGFGSKSKPKTRVIWRNSIIFDVLFGYIFSSLNEIIQKICEDLPIGISQLSEKFGGYWSWCSDENGAKDVALIWAVT